MSAWATIGIALASSALGGIAGSLLTTRMTIRHERREALRTRMIEAADDYSLKCQEAALELYRAAHLITPEDAHTEFDDEAEAAEEFDEVREAGKAVLKLVDAAHAKLPRVQLLFGFSADASGAAAALVATLRAGGEMLREMPPEVSLARRRHQEAMEWNESFIGYARFAIGDEVSFRRETRGRPAGGLDRPAG